LIFLASKRLLVIWWVVGGATALIDLNLAHRAHQLSLSLHTQRKAWTYILSEIFTTDARFSHRGPMASFLNCLICMYTFLQQHFTSFGKWKLIEQNWHVPDDRRHVILSHYIYGLIINAVRNSKYMASNDKHK
jgi:hypothetical protein